VGWTKRLLTCGQLHASCSPGRISVSPAVPAVLGPPVGSFVPVVYLPHRPRSARADTRAHRVTALGLPAVLAASCLFLAVSRLARP